jgi:hypothetical protein
LSCGCAHAARVESEIVNTSIADPPGLAADAAPQAGEAPAPPQADTGKPVQDAAQQPAGAAERTCTSCGAPMADGQDWCLQCGAGAPGSLGTPGWRPAAIALAVTAALLLGAAAAAYAALNSSPPKAHVLTSTVAAVAPPAAAPATPTPATPLPATPVTPTKIPPLATKPPKIPLTAMTPKATAPTTPAAPTNTTEPASTTPATGEESSSQAIVLDTNAASTYNPYAYPATNFGDPSLAIDGDNSTGWTAQVDPSTAPKMAEGLLLDLKSAQKLSAAAVVTSTPGMTVQLYGANTKTVPTSITEPSWVALSHSIKLQKRHQRIPLRESGHAFRFITLWISRAPAASVGTPQAPGHVSVNELELFPAQ